MTSWGVANEKYRHEKPATSPPFWHCRRQPADEKETIVLYVL
jgi:hypothetical protein